MNQDNSNGTEPTVSNNSKVRRTFLKRATAGAVIASIPGRSAWAGISGSIVASGHGSDFNQGLPTMLLDACQVASSMSGNFQDYFVGESPISGSGNPDVQAILQGGDPDPSDVNAAILVMLYNAINSGAAGVYYPVLSQHNNSASDFAIYLYTQATADPSGVANLLWDTIGTNSSSGINTSCPTI